MPHMTMPRPRRRGAMRPALALAALVLAALALPVAAQAEARAPSRTRVALGPQLTPSFPGSDTLAVRPFIEVDIARGAYPFEFEAPDENFGFAVARLARLEIGPTLSFEGKRRAADVGTALPDVGFTLEVGAFAQTYLIPALRLRADLRRGIGGHKAWAGGLSADWIARDGDRWLISAGPRITLGDARYHRAYFSVAPQDALATGLPAFDASGGVSAVGGTLGFIRQLDRRWSLHGYARYDRLVGDAVDSPIVRRHGAPDQVSLGLAFSRTFGPARR